MSQPTSAHAYSQFLLQDYCNTSSRALFVFDYILTFGDEVQHMWRRRFSPATVLFLLNRYTNLAGTLFEFLVEIPIRTNLFLPLILENIPRITSCNAVVRTLQCELVLAQIYFAAFSCLRVFAVMNRRWLPAAVVCGAAMVSPVINTYIYARETPIFAPSPSLGCAGHLDITLKQYNKTRCFAAVVTIIARVFTIVCDALVVFFTIFKTVDVRRDASYLNIRVGLVALTLLRDSVVYFVFLLLVNLAQIILSSLNGPMVVYFFVSPLTSMLISRMMLNLREVNLDDDGADFPSVFVPQIADGAGDSADELALDTPTDGAEIPLRRLGDKPSPV
ncbi:hypothetical protein A0H81_12534 [Grifola frondosa]|uniref:DUF6533 domain-containing protein n=1 Tax=Grifola frondosa TaxID=5627 RepID=A0A1C7LWX1_GRIFR|nr:hypothetical protein A0H81_12534 [Grifola frondosa]